MDERWTCVGSWATNVRISREVCSVCEEDGVNRAHTKVSESWGLILSYFSSSGRKETEIR